MKPRIVSLFVLLISFFNLNFLCADDVEWDSATTYLIPDDGDTYYLADNSVTITDNFVIEGLFELRANSTLDSSSFIISNSNVLRVAGGVLVLDTDGLLYNDGEVVLEGGRFKQTGGGFYNSYTTTATFEISGGFFYQLDGLFENGYAAEGFIEINSGTFDDQSLDIFKNGVSGGGTITINGGTLLFNKGPLYNGYGSAGTIYIIGGTLLQVGGELYNGKDSSGLIQIDSGTYNLSGGTIEDRLETIGEIILNGGSFIKVGGLLDGNARFPGVWTVNDGVVVGI